MNVLGTRHAVIPPTLERRKTELAEEAFTALNAAFFDGALPDVPVLDRAAAGDDSKMAELCTEMISYPEESLYRIELHHGLETAVLEAAGGAFFRDYPRMRREMMFRRLFTTVLISTILHEMCHLFCVINRIIDTDADGRHTKAFAGVAASHGLDVSDSLEECRTVGIPEERFDWNATRLDMGHRDVFLALGASPWLD